ncbi:MAG: peptidoglycan-binding protein LysM [Granulosicoccus sp.]
MFVITSQPHVDALLAVVYTIGRICNGYCLFRCFYNYTEYRIAAMGLFDFAKDMGKKLFDSDDDAPEKIKGALERDNPGISDLKVEYNGGKVSLGGKAASAEAMEKAVLMAGNVQGVTDVDVSGLDSPAAAGGVLYYTIQSGDTLSKIAKEYLGDAMAYPQIFEANREVIKDPDLIYPGQKIRIPGANTTVA